MHLQDEVPQNEITANLAISVWDREILCGRKIVPPNRDYARFLACNMAKKTKPVPANISFLSRKTVYIFNNYLYYIWIIFIFELSLNELLLAENTIFIVLRLWTARGPQAQGTRLLLTIRYRVELPIRLQYLQ